jgi:hypothetical protein
VCNAVTGSLTVPASPSLQASGVDSSASKHLFLGVLILEADHQRDDSPLALPDARIDQLVNGRGIEFGDEPAQAIRWQLPVEEQPVAENER